MQSAYFVHRISYKKYTRIANIFKNIRKDLIHIRITIWYVFAERWLPVHNLVIDQESNMKMFYSNFNYCVFIWVGLSILKVLY